MRLNIRDEVMAVFRYEPESGHFFWRNPGPYARPDGLAGGIKDGYVQLRLGGRGGRMFRAHRLAWLIMTGEFPPKGFEIDHINGDRADNRWSNLRLVTRSQNNMNGGRRTDNTSGVRGVSFRSNRGSWHARIVVKGRAISLGDFRSKRDAIRARREAEREYFGQFAASPERAAAKGL